MAQERDPYIHQDEKYDRKYTEFLSKIYVLKDSDTREEKFIGATNLPIASEYERLRAEMYARKLSPVGQWWRDMFAAKGDRPFMVQIEQIKNADAGDAISDWVEFYKKQGKEVQIIGEYMSAFEASLNPPLVRADCAELIIEVLSKKDHMGMTMRDIQRSAVGKFSEKEIKEISQKLIKENKIIYLKIATAGRPREAYIHIKHKNHDYSKE